ncbi:E3 ubiquitin-protein ligase MSL2-like isoform X1 [Daphnia pulex]|uniref:E3 ubiquitin-protein ligase MSL2-like isoform X1 n=1 Tax=Daphnia pulex TaxID=6669 RepID=UPI001EDF667E|nr:E3 ubiquitin-protein ligase MSL2-like isoform X1 [Daphnia pulex]
MNATSLYVSTCRLVVQANTEEQSSWNDLYRLLPYLRQALSCTVCDLLLVEPYSPESSCQHHVCKSCRGRKKKLKPSCSWCKCYNSYSENVQLRILLQCYKKLNEYLVGTSIFRKLKANESNGGTSGLSEIIEEGAGFKDEFNSYAGLSKSALKQLPCALVVNPTVSVQTQTNNSILVEKNLETGANQSLSNSPFQTTSVVNLADVSALPANANNTSKDTKQSRNPKQKLKRKGCRCGNATSSPGKLTCCGQRCPCYVEAKACTDCRCRGCRNPHIPGGKKIRFFLSDVGDSTSNTSESSLVTQLNLPQYGVQRTSVYSTSPQMSFEKVPSTLLVDDEKSNSGKSETLDIDV